MTQKEKAPDATERLLMVACAAQNKAWNEMTDEDKRAMRTELERLQKMQIANQKEAEQLATDLCARIMKLGFTFDATIVPMANPETGLVSHAGVDIRLRIMTLGEWQNVQKEKIRHDLNPLGR